MGTMKIKNFRYLFDNTDDGVVLSGGIWDAEEDQYTNFAYVCGMRNKKETDKKGQGVMFRFEKSGEPCHIFILASFSIHYIKVLLRMVHWRRVRTVLLPYVPKQQRLALLQWYQGEGEDEPEFSGFMEHPYSYLKSAGVSDVYMIYGNGEAWHGNERQKKPGHYFELAEEKELQGIKAMEGCYVPVMKAGHIIENGWLFYFGQYGHNLSLYEQPGGVISSSIAMFQGPIDTDSRKVDSVMTGKVFARQRDCEPYFKQGEKNCFYRCIYQEDFAVYRRHKKTYSAFGCFGTFSAGNINMGRYLSEVCTRFRDVLRQVRAITVPGCGNREYWNRQCLTMIFGDNIQYWVCGLDHTTSPFVLSDIIVASPQNCVVTISEEYGYCFSGYLTPVAEETIDM